jgi:PRTRC genetic system protein B
MESKAKIREIANMSYEAAAALLVYELHDPNPRSQFPYEDYASHRPPRNFVTLHRIRGGKLCEGRPLTRDKLLRFCKTAMPALTSQITYFPENLLAYTPYNTTMLWWRPSEVRHLYFDKSTGIKSGKAPLPTLLFRFSGIGLTVFALMHDTRPAMQTRLFHSPFFNWGCMGNVHLPDNPTPADIPALESLFFRSAFTLHNNPKLKGTTGQALWKGLVGSGTAKFPNEHLVDAGPMSDLFKRTANDY